MCHAGDLYRQTAAAMQRIKTIFTDLGSDIEKLVKLTVFYVNGTDVDPLAYQIEIVRLLGTHNRPVIAMVPVCRLSHPGVQVEIDAVGVDSQAPRRYLADPVYGRVVAGISQALRCGKYLFIGGTNATDACGEVQNPGDSVKQTHRVLARLEGLLAEFGADRRDLVKLNNWFVIGGNAEEWAHSAQVRADFYHEPGPVATGHPLHSLGVAGLSVSTDCWAMLGADGERLPKRHAWPQGHWDWPIHLPFKHGLQCGEVIFIGGQVSLDEQSR